MSIVNVVALSTEKAFFTTLRRYPPGPVLDFLIAAREHELETGFREEWLQQSKAHRELLADTITQRQGPLAARDIALRYEEFRLRVRPLLLVLMTLYMNSDGFLDDRVTIENRELLVRSQRTGRPLVLAGTHFGLYVGLGIALATLGHRVTGVLANYEKPLIGDLLETYCPKGRANLTLVSVPDRWVLVRCRNALRRGDHVTIGMEASEAETPPKVILEFLGHQVRAPEGPAYLASVTGADLVLAASICREGPSRARLILDDPIRVERGRQGVAAGITKLWQRLEYYVSTYPDQWVGWELMPNKMMVTPSGEPV